MTRVRRVLALLTGALVSGCGSSASLEFASDPTPSIVDSGEPSPYPDSAGIDPDSGKVDSLAAPDAELPPKCADGKDGKGNVCVRVLRAADGPSITADSKALFGLDGHGAVLIGLASVKPSAREVAFVAQTWFPTESSGAGKLAASELPKIAELPVPPGTYWAFAMFRDQEPFMRPGMTIGDYVPRLVELPQVTVTEGAGVSVDVKLYPVRAVDIEAKVAVTPLGSATGPARFWLVDDKKNILGEGGASCLDLSLGKTEVVRLFTTYTGAMDVAGALFDFNPIGDDGTGKVPMLPPGTLFCGPSGNTVKIADGEWLAPTRKKIDLDKLQAFSGARPADLSLNCAADPYIAPK